MSTAVALVLFLAPSAHHRLRFGDGDKEFMLRKRHEAILGSVAMALAFTGTVYVVTDLVFRAASAGVAAAGRFALTAWRWRAPALQRIAAERRS